jgi:hypothetical protein
LGNVTHFAGLKGGALATGTILTGDERERLLRTASEPGISKPGFLGRRLHEYVYSLASEDIDARGGTLVRRVGRTMWKLMTPGMRLRAQHWLEG